MIEKLKELKEKIEEHERIQTDYQERYNQHLQVFIIKNKEIAERAALLTNEIFELKEEIKKEALIKYNENGEKKLEGGVGIRVMNKLVYEEKTAFEWAKKHQLALSLDKRSFESIAKTQELEFVKKEEVPSATIPSKIEI